MRMALYAPKDHARRHKLQEIISQVVPEHNCDVYGDVMSLESGLRKQQSRPNLAIVMAPTFDDLMDLVDVGWMLEDINTIVCLPDRDHDTITLGRLLQPSFLTFCDSDFTEMGAVLNNIVKHSSASRNLAS